jgi:predicted RNA binding protein YcfA (HicA-like mRNA interferase family)
MDSRTIIRLLELAGWRSVCVTGGHHHFRHRNERAQQRWRIL